MSAACCLGAGAKGEPRLAGRVPEVRLEPPQADLHRRQPRAAGGDVARMVRVAILRIVHRGQQLGPGHLSTWGCPRPVAAPRVAADPLIRRQRLTPAKTGTAPLSKRISDCA
jgi:hypothetical protein